MTDPQEIPYSIKTESFSSNFRNKTRCLFSQLLFSIVLEFLARAISKEKEIKGIQIGNEGVKSSLFANDIILYIKNPKDSTKGILETIKCNKVAVYREHIKMCCISIYLQ